MNRICKNCELFKKIKLGEKFDNCDMSDLTEFSKNSGGFFPAALWGLMHPSTPVRDNKECDNEIWKNYQNFYHDNPDIVSWK